MSRTRFCPHCGSTGIQLNGQSPEILQQAELPEVKAVVICSETGRHKEHIAAAAKAKKHMFAEKPLGLCAADVWPLVDRAEHGGWELDRVRIAPDGTRRVVLRRKIIRFRPPVGLQPRV